MCPCVVAPEPYSPAFNKQEVADFYRPGERAPHHLAIWRQRGAPIVSERNIEEVITSLRAQLDYFKEVAPTSRILFIGPSDMSTRKGGNGMHTYKNLPMYIDRLKAMCLEEGVAYWDLYAVMGGKDSMVSWVNKGWAGSDYVHFSTQGAERVANVLAGTFMLYYDYYTFRQKSNQQQ